MFHRPRRRCFLSCMKFSQLLLFLSLLALSCKKSDPQSGQKALLTFGFTKVANPSLSADVSGLISGQQVTLMLPAGTNASALKATFSSSPLSSVAVNGVRQESGVTPNDFTRPVAYRVTAEDGTTADYTVTLTVTKSNARELLSLQFLKTANSSLTDDVTVPLTASKTSYLVTLPTGAAPAALKATFTASPGATVTVNGAAQTSGATVLDFSKPVTYRVTAENGEFKEYTVESSVQVDLPTVENAVKAFMSKYNVPGMSVAITKDERLVYAKGYGLADKASGTPVTTGSLFRIASVSKPITALAVLKLVDEGKLSLDQKVFGAGGILGTTYGKQPYTPQLEQITVRQLLDHTAGGDAWNHLWNYPTRIDPFYQPEWRGYTQAQVLSATIDTRPVTQTPGTKNVYSNVSSNFAGRVVEKVAGMSYEKYVQEALLKPLGISASTMRIGGSTLAERFPNEVVYHNPYAGYDQPYDFSVPRFDAHGGWITTAPNLARLLTHADGATAKADLISAKSWADMVTPTKVSIPAGGYAGYGLGWSASNNGTGVAYWHAGGMAGTASYWLKIGTYTFTILINTRSAAADFYGAIDQLCYQMTANLTLTGYMKGDQFEVFYK